jgi:signal peptidase II
VRVDLTVLAAILVLDQVTKWLVLWAFGAAIIPTTVTPFFNLVLVWNEGVSFGLFQGNDSPVQRLLLTGLAVVVAGGLFWWLRTGTHDRSMRWALRLVIAGAIGNGIDRVVHGAVVDFLDFHVGGWHWPAFNVADSAIVVGAVLLLVDGLWRPRPAST